jgi:uncharacterized protein YjiS (DUF1127 family)
MSFSNLFVSARKAMSDWRRRERAYAELMSLDDRSLCDIGIRRSEIAALVHGVHGSPRAAGVSKSPAAKRSTRQAA